MTRRIKWISQSFLWARRTGLQWDRRGQMEQATVPAYAQRKGIHLCPSEFTLVTMLRLISLRHSMVDKVLPIWLTIGRPQSLGISLPRSSTLRVLMVVPHEVGQFLGLALYM